MPKTTLKSTDPDSLTKLDSFLTQFRDQAAHSNRPWELQYEKSEDGESVLVLKLDAPVEPANG